MILGDIAGSLAAIFTTITFLPQVIAAEKTNKTACLSAMTLIFSFIGNALWMVNSLIYNNPSMYYSGIIIGTVLSRLLYLKYRNGEIPSISKIVASIFPMKRTDP